MDRISLYTDDNLIGQSIHRYMIDNNKNISVFRYQDIAQKAGMPFAGIVIINVIHQDISAGETMSRLNMLRGYLLNCSRLILVVKSDIADLCLELIGIDNVLILTEKSSLGDFYLATSTPRNGRQAPAQKKLSARELQVLELTMSCHNNKRIATLLDIDHKTVHSHKMHIMKKLGMDNSRMMNQKIVNLYQC